MNRALNYRPDIDGLRAVAVLGVLIFHLGSHGLPGGFLGVDVFFVISGFLITTILLRDLQRQSFSLPAFWMRRIKRLYPALFTMVGVTALAAALIQLRPERQDLIGQALAAIFSVENFLLWDSTHGYWASSSDSIALLHTWSLSLEEQYYLIFPPLLAWAYRRNKRIVPGLLISLFSLSFILCLVQTVFFRSAAFYLLPARLWELLAGGLLALHLHRRAAAPAAGRGAAALALLGLFLVLLSFFVIANDETFPGYKALLPCVGAVLLLRFGRACGPANAFLSFKPVVYVGRISYSLYLWHWPVFVFARYLSVHPHTPLLLGLTFALAVLSYHLVESPLRTGFPGSMKLLAAMPVLVGLCLLPLLLLPASPLVPEAYARMDSPSAQSHGSQFEGTRLLRRNEAGVRIGNPERPLDICLIGSSHARVLGPGLAAWIEIPQWSGLVQATSSIDISTTQPTRKRPFALAVNETRFAKLAELKPRIILVSGKWSFERDRPDFEPALKEKLEQLSHLADRVIVLSQVPMIALPERYEGALTKYIMASSRSYPALRLPPDPRVPEANRRVEGVVQGLALEQVVYQDIYSLFINPEGFVRVRIDGQFMYADYHHLNDAGGLHVFEALLGPVLQAAPPLPSHN